MMFEYFKDEAVKTKRKHLKSVSSIQTEKFEEDSCSEETEEESRKTTEFEYSRHEDIEEDQAVKKSAPSSSSSSSSSSCSVSAKLAPISGAANDINTEYNVNEDDFEGGVTTEDIKTSLNEITTHKRDSVSESESTLSDDIVRMIGKQEKNPVKEKRKSESSSNKYDDDDFIGKK